MAGNLKKAIRTLYFYVVKLPLVYIIVPVGFVFEFLVTFPFAVMVSIDAYRRRKR